MNLRRPTFILLTIFFALALKACQQVDQAKPVSYEGPISEATDVETLYTEQNVLKLKMTGKKVIEFQNGDREFPEGLFLEFYDENGNLTSTLKANHAYFFKQDYRWRGRGNVEVKNIVKQEQLNTEELFWKPDTKRIYTDKFVTLREQSDVMYGTGLDAAQDLSDYTIKNFSGEFDAREENNR